jgi:hypothetical protein
MYEELFGKSIDQIVILLAAEDGTVQSYTRDKKEYADKLGTAIQDFYKYYEEQNKDKVSK